jgi:hypothetical protein
VVSLAIALSLPDGFPGRDFILAVNFPVLLVTVLVQGTTLAPLVRLMLKGDFTLRHGGSMTEEQARARVAAVQLAKLERQCGTMTAPSAILACSNNTPIAPPPRAASARKRGSDAILVQVHHGAPISRAWSKSSFARPYI